MIRAFFLFWRGLLAPPQPLRVGLLNTGELVLVGDHGHVQVLSSSATDTIRDVLDAADVMTGPQLRLAEGGTA